MNDSLAPYPFVEVAVSVGTWSLVELAYLDTGHEGGLVVPVEFANEILAAPSWIPHQLADDRRIDAPTWTGILQIMDREFVADVTAMGTRLLLGRDILDRLTVCFEHGRRLTIQF